jgi:thiol-disulfide isomerase/thioredoxin
MARLFISLILVVAVLATAHAVEMELEGIDGSNQQLSDFKGKWLVVNYWATWCPPCIEEMPELQSFHDEYEKRDAMVIGINTELVGKNQLLGFLDDYFITYPVYTSPPIQESALGAIPGLPTTFLVSPQGNVVARQVGGVTREMIENFIQKWEAK